MNRIKALVLFFCMINLVNAEEVTDKNRERGHSVREVIKQVNQAPIKAVDKADGFERMFQDGVFSGRIETMYGLHVVKDNENPYATAVGGQLKYELAQFHGFNAGMEFTTSHDINFLTGDGDKQNPVLSSTDGEYTELSQAYLNYTQDEFNLRLGRQLIDTPLADSDDTRIVDNTFEAAIATFENENFYVLAGYLKRWQGTDTGLDVDRHWQDTGKDGTYFGGITYSIPLMDASFWYYDISEADALNTATGNVANKTAYADISFHFHPNEDYFIHLNAQYLNQDESHNSNVESDIYGFLAEVVYQENFSFSLAYNKAQKRSGKGSFSGFGGGTLYTNMDNLVLDALSVDREVDVIVAGVIYRYKDFGFLYAYGDFNGDKDSLGKTESIIEQNIGIEYKPYENFNVIALCTINDDSEDTHSGAYFKHGDFVNYRVSVAYNF